MQPIETVYRGYRFRSRLEARWAVFFTHLQIPFEYEPQGFDLGNGVWYLPDFYLPDQKLWFEVKGVPPTDEEKAKADRFIAQQGPINPAISITIFTQIPECDEDGDLIFSDDDPTYKVRWNTDEQAIQQSRFAAHWCLCPLCGKYNVIVKGTAYAMPCLCLTNMIDIIFATKNLTEADKHWWGAKIWNLECCLDAPSLLAAYDAARMARFEHGRSGN